MSIRKPDALLGEYSPERFLRDYWQQRPLLIRNAWPGFSSPISPEELAGLACEEGVTSRLVLEKGGAYPWEMRFGPFAEDEFTSLPETHWSLLVQEVDRLIPEVADVLQPFRFLPNWRIDDVQISYAPAHGNVGAHVDSYDVFLLQAEGSRRWQISHEPLGEDEEAFVEDADVRILKEFSPDEEWVVEPGDLLYLPPRVPHYGVALERCMTYSIGFRAPSQAELLQAAGASTEDLIPQDARYQDPAPPPRSHAGEITAAEREELRTLLRTALASDERLDKWLGTYLTRPTRGSAPPLPEERVLPSHIVNAVRNGGRIRRSAVAHFSHISHDDGRVTLFVCGRSYDLTGEAAEMARVLTSADRLDSESLGPFLDRGQLVLFLVDLANEGYLYLDQSE